MVGKYLTELKNLAQHCFVRSFWRPGPHAWLELHSQGCEVQAPPEDRPGGGDQGQLQQGQPVLQPDRVQSRVLCLLLRVPALPGRHGSEDSGPGHTVLAGHTDLEQAGGHSGQGHPSASLPPPTGEQAGVHALNSTIFRFYEPCFFSFSGL